MSMLPAAFVDIWPADGGPVHLSSVNGAVLAVTTSKDIWDPSSGSFDLVLPPGGPYGPNATPQWVDIITLNSLVIIGLQRSVPYVPRARIVMVGVVTAVSQNVQWRYGGGVHRVCRVQGKDFSYFFSQFGSYCEMLLRFSEAGLVGLPGGLAINGVVNGSPEQIATTYYNNIMAGKSGLMSGTKFSYSGSTLSFNDLVQTDFRPYPNLSISIPCAWNFLAVEGAWNDFFLALFPFPWYEFTIATEEPASGAQLSIGGGPMFSPVSPVVVARPMPIPKLTGDADSIDTSLWDALPIVTPDGNQVLDHEEGYSVADVRNFYVLNPSTLNTLLGVSNQQNAPFMFQAASWIDAASIQRYGYRPRPDNIYWFSDPSGNQAQQNAGNENAFDDLVKALALVPVSYHEPTPLMLSGSVLLNLRPDIMPGVKLRFSYDKALTQWDAYVRTVNHSFIFGEGSTTRLGYSRGLPSEVYADHGTLLALYQGKGSKVLGEYGINASSKGIQKFNLTNAQSQLESLSTAFSTPGAK